ncbi:hypothetical protein H9W91_35810 (plasmid) [Streptomyces alfalfae]|uniref:hypothetical protein n=1 Tax=Streptomyces alfalfae TaxID=1642299 RepID=UPI001BAC7624|nr:hypothetical protein [Streptomyces alfalfae]QUI36303.1 hypothetical protein H9W91_35810 [Streptomyces alfalfae]
MFRIVRTRTLATLHEECARVESIETETLSLRADLVGQELNYQAALRQAAEERDVALTEAEAARKQVEAALAQVLLDAEDRVALRALLRTARKQAKALDRVFVLFRYGALHSVHASMDAAEIAAEAEGAARSGWTAQAPGAASPPADQVAWRVQPLKVGGAE